MSGKHIAIIDEHLDGHGRVIVEEALRAGFSLELNEEGDPDIADACAVIQQESEGRNVFGCDFKNVVGDVPPFCGQDVTRERVQRLINQPGYRKGTAKMNGVGLSQLTWYEFVLRAEEMGGANIPRYQLRVAFELLAGYMAEHDYLWAIELYNGDDEKPGSPYVNGVLEKRKVWVERFNNIPQDKGTKVVVIDGYEARVAVPVEGGWFKDKETGLWLAAPDSPNTDLKTEGPWVRAKKVVNPKPEPKRWSWPVANAQPGYLGDGSYIDLHPTRYDTVWLPEIEAVARYMVDTFGVWVVTYIGHPPPEMVEGVVYDHVSFDIWGPAYRGDYSHQDRVDAAFWWFFNNGQAPYIRWCIRNGEIWIDDGYEWRPYWDHDPWSDGPHRGHAHVTCYSLKERT